MQKADFISRYLVKRPEFLSVKMTKLCKTVGCLLYVAFSWYLSGMHVYSALTESLLQLWASKQACQGLCRGWWLRVDQLGFLQESASQACAPSFGSTSAACTCPTCAYATWVQMRASLQVRALERVRGEQAFGERLQKSRWLHDVQALRHLPG